MKQITLLALLLWGHIAFSQNPVEREGFLFGAAAGISAFQLNTPYHARPDAGALSFPNFKIGYMLRPNTALVLCLPGSVYTYKGPNRQRDRGFEGIVPGVQFWPTQRWWLLGGAGLSMDAPAFYDIKNESERKFYFGPGALLGTAYELWRKGNKSLDLQARLHYGRQKLPEGIQEGVAISLLLGFNWY